MEINEVRKELGKLAHRAAAYFVVALVMMAATLVISDLSSRLAIGSIGAIFVGLTLLKINELDRWPCRHCI